MVRIKLTVTRKTTRRATKAIVLLNGKAIVVASTLRAKKVRRGTTDA